MRLAKYFKYGTDKEREIWMLRYGFSFEEIEWASECVDSIDETEIKFNDKINALDDAQLKSIEQYVHELCLLYRLSTEKHLDSKAKRGFSPAWPFLYAED